MASAEAALKAVKKAARAGQLGRAAADNLQLWLTGEAFAEYRDEVAAAVATGEFESLDDAFGQVIPFGTAGRRGREGVGPNRINARTIAESAAGLGDYVREAFPTAAPTCVIAYDTRRNSESYGKLCAEVLAARGLQVALFEAPRATPMLAYAVLARRALCGIMITASHNPPDDNGFKAYWRSGGQVVPPHDGRIIDYVNRLSRESIAREPLAQGIQEDRITILGHEADADYWHYVSEQAVTRFREARLVYSPLQGTGGVCVVPVLERAGFEDVHVVASQAQPSSEFEAVANQVANPEAPAAMKEVIDLCRELDADAGIASDPDADRIGFVAREASEESGYRFFNGNQIGVLVAWFACQAMSREGIMPERPEILKSAVTSELITRIGEDYGVHVRGELPVGFRWMGEILDALMDDGQLIAAIEESHGVNRGSRVRDKDAASAALALAELTAELKAKGLSVSELLDQLYLKYGYHAELMHSVTQPKKEIIDAILASLRANPPRELDGLPVVSVEDRLEGRYLDPVTHQPVVENFLIYQLGGDSRIDGVKVAIRPSGTEPKMKVYVQGYKRVPEGGSLQAVKAAVDHFLADLPLQVLAAAGQAQ
ncbi:MAG: phospho-sugar mutase [Armatimonadetes bacterium]|nr:phospho-sugar mutase [Armatimonadota bacterium]